MRNSLCSKVEAFIASNHLLDNGKRYLVALSGGADSVALLLILRDLNYTIEAVHCNFMLRGEESARDERFCRDLCQRLDIPFHTVHFDTRTYCEIHKVSIEMGARQLRYAHFAKLSHDIGTDGVCVAHHMDDSVETVLINLLRGTGIHGLTGIAPRRGIILRPLLCLRRQELREYLKEKNQNFVDDSSNFIPDVQRNKLRLKVFPLLNDINPAFVENIHRSAENLSQTAAICDKVMELKTAEATVETTEGNTVSFLKAKIDSEAFLFHLLAPCHFNPAQVRDVFSALHDGVGRRFISDSHELFISRHTIDILPAEQQQAAPLRIPETGNYRLADGSMLRLAVFDRTEHFSFSTSPATIHLDVDKVRFPLTLRPVENADRFHPLGMSGSKLLSDFLTDLKLSIPQKRRQQVITDAEGRIIWVLHQRIDHRFRITPTTTRILEISL